MPNTDYDDTSKNFLSPYITLFFILNIPAEFKPLLYMFQGLHPNHFWDVVFLLIAVWTHSRPVWRLSFQNQWFDGLRTVFPFQ